MPINSMLRLAFPDRIAKESAGLPMRPTEDCAELRWAWIFECAVAEIEKYTGNRHGNRAASGHRLRNC